MERTNFSKAMLLGKFDRREITTVESADPTADGEEVFMPLTQKNLTTRGAETGARVKSNEPNRPKLILKTQFHPKPRKGEILKWQD